MHPCASAGQALPEPVLCSAEHPSHGLRYVVLQPRGGETPLVGAVRFNFARSGGMIPACGGAARAAAAL